MCALFPQATASARNQTLADARDEQATFTIQEAIAWLPYLSQDTLDVYSVNTHRCVMEHRGALGRRVTLG